MLSPDYRVREREGGGRMALYICLEGAGGGKPNQNLKIVSSTKMILTVLKQGGGGRKFHPGALD